MAAWLLVTMLLPAAAAGQWQYHDVERIVALSDIHGAYEPLVRTLQSAAVIGDGLGWTGGNAHLVIVGDILDRGPDSRSAMDLLMKLEPEAEAAGGKVHVLIGNHEAMNLIADLRYVSKSEYAAFAAEESAADRERWFVQFAAQRAPAGRTPKELRELFDRSFPAGFFAHRKAFSASGKYGRWLLEKPIIVVINGTAFVHGGVSPMIGKIGLDGVNGVLRGEMQRYVEELDVLYEAGVLLPTDNFYKHPAILDAFMPPIDADVGLLNTIASVKALNHSEVHSSEGPLWYRGNAACSELIEADRLEASLASIGADRVVIGHTPTYGRRVYQRYGGSVVEVDTGMYGEYYQGSGSAVIIEGDTLAVVDEADPRPRAVEPSPRRVGQRPAGFLTASDIERLLASGRIVGTTETEAGAKVVTVTDGDNTLEALFEKRAGRGIFPEAAAYRLDLLLGLEMVPVTVRRDLGRDEGTLQFKVPGVLDEQVRSEKGYGVAAQCALPDQWAAMLVFDALIYNEGRFRQTMLYSPDVWQLLLVGHGDAFTNSKGRPRHLENSQLDLNNRWRKALQSLNDDRLTEHLGDVLDKRRINALGKRRDELLALP